MTDWLTDLWLTYWLNHWLNKWQNKWLIDWLTHGVSDWLTDWMTEWLTRVTEYWLNDCVTDTMTDQEKWVIYWRSMHFLMFILFLQNLGRRQSTNHWRLFWPWSLAQWFNFSTHSYCRLLASRLDTSTKSFIISHLSPIFTHFLRLAHEDLPQSQWGTVYKGLWGTKMNTLTLWLPLVTKKEFLLTLSRQCQADKWQE